MKPGGDVRAAQDNGEVLISLFAGLLTADGDCPPAYAGDPRAKAAPNQQAGSRR